MEDIQRSDPTPTLLRNVSIATAVCCFLVAIFQAIVHHVGYFNLRVASTLLGHKGALGEFIAEGFGASLLAPLIHIGLASFFKSKRNSRTRWKILLGWSVFVLLLNLVQLS
jgi:hypothetical protein